MYLFSPEGSVLWISRKNVTAVLTVSLLALENMSGRVTRSVRVRARCARRQVRARARSQRIRRREGSQHTIFTAWMARF
ncbi:hypothetical protein [Cupriavidus metallidurans]|uniref:hypothetical protein n=1 Tax=Cupriavidus metallidurans TaxID=119219 RepID=UPI00055D3E7F|nr:hypothetical protein [Cupriavidus metallidurans]